MDIGRVAMRRISEKTVYFTIIAILSIATAFSSAITQDKPIALDGRVIGIIDGDTLDILTPEKQTIRVRLAGIDAPEKAQPFGMKAKAFLSEKAYGCDARLENKKKDRYGRTVAHVNACGADINATMVKAGYAWVYTQYASRSDESAWIPLEENARKNHYGLWADQQKPIEPWNWRKSKKD